MVKLANISGVTLNLNSKRKLNLSEAVVQIDRDVVIRDNSGTVLGTATLTVNEDHHLVFKTFIDFNSPIRLDIENGLIWALLVSNMTISNSFENRNENKVLDIEPLSIVLTKTQPAYPGAPMLPVKIDSISSDGE